MFNPFEQFEVSILQKLEIGNIDLSVTNFFLYLLLGSFFVFSFYRIGLKNKDVIPNNLQILVENIYTFILAVII